MNNYVNMLMTLELDMTNVNVYILHIVVKHLQGTPITHLQNRRQYFFYFETRGSV